MRELRRFTLANGEVVYSAEGFGEKCVVVYCERDEGTWKVSKGSLMNGNISEYGLVMKHIVNLGTVRTETEAENVAELVLTEDDLPDYDTDEILDRISGADDVEDMVD